MKFSCSFQPPPPPFIAEETVRLFLARHQKPAAIFRSQYEKKKKNTHTITSGEHLMLPPPQSERCPILKTISQPEQLNSSLSQSVRFFNGSNPNQTRTTTKADPPPHTTLYPPRSLLSSDRLWTVGCGN